MCEDKSNTVLKCVRYLRWKEPRVNMWAVLEFFLSWCREWTHLQVWFEDVLSEREVCLELIPERWVP